MGVRRSLIHQHQPLPPTSTVLPRWLSGVVHMFGPHIKIFPPRRHLLTALAENRMFSFLRIRSPTRLSTIRHFLFGKCSKKLLASIAIKANPETPAKARFPEAMG